MSTNGRRDDMRRVVVTGMGVVTPIGETPAEFSASLRAGRSGITQKTRPAGSRISCQECACPARSAPSFSSLATSAARSSVWMSTWTLAWPAPSR